ncbi:MAG: hypothetical protein HOB98_00140 [Gammaproteobacteria bacterium]|nr:hypothetical protein [Gammaproteobacteria bacterium]MBT4378805.1 hypothetical protein [Gammaproteobacteria bacterium]MBT4614834.1 hypothetical protein [Gammaproteobacteria bacterium]MBT5444145.1 hypothetical protein [Gammaproteobacteria bacterium]MBT5792797.1 hypothetical protein [Gammaproteobacteria bacterium]
MQFRALLRQSLYVTAMLLFLQSCTTSVVVEGTVPTPLVSVIPARMGVYYSDEFRRFKHEEVFRDSGGWHIDLGKQNLRFFQNLTKSLFAEIQEVHQPPLTTEEMRDLDGVFIPSIEKYGFLTPSIMGVEFYSASIEYRVAMYDKVGAKIGDWNIVGYGKSEGGMFSSDDAINEATVQAIRDGGARIAIELIDQPAVQAWLQSRHESYEPSAGPPGVAESIENIERIESIENSETPENVDGPPDA